MIRAAWFSLGFVLSLIVGGLLLAAEPEEGPATLDNLAGLESAAIESCLKRGLSLRSITVIYGDAGKPVSAQVGCGEPRRTKA
jgi:hypothetical protein